jgi:succinoglycan biosynthesis transport protein ExoP
MSKSLSSIPSVLMRRWFPATLTFISVIATALAYLTVTPRFYEAQARLALDDRQVSVSGIGRDLSRLPEGGAGSPNPLANESELIKSQPLLQRAIDRVTASGARNVPPISELSKELRIKIVPATNILELSYRGRYPDITANILNAVAASAVEDNLETIRAGARSIKEFLEAEVPKQLARLAQIEAAENRYRQENQLVSVEDQTKELVQSLGTTQAQERDLSTQLQEVMIRNASLTQLVKASSPQTAFTAARIGQDEELKTLRTKVNDLDARVIEARSRLGDQHPDLLALTDQRDNVRKLYEAQLSRIVPGAASASPLVAGDALSQDLISKLITSDIDQAAIRQKLAAVRQIRLSLQAQLANFPDRQQPLTTLTRNREELETTLKLLQAKLQEASVAEAQLVSNIKIIEKADLPTKPEWPKKPSILVTAIALGLVLATGVVLALELLDNSLYDVSEAELLLGQPALGRIPFLPHNAILRQPSESRLDMHYFMEPYRKLLSTLEFRQEAQLRRVVISSAIANEGKSTVAAHLAIVAAMQSRRTLLIDTSLWQPEQHSLFNLQLSPGLAEVLEDKMTLEQSVQPTRIANLSLLTCGSLSHSLFAIGSTKMKALLTEAEAQFDLIILDTPSIASCADAFELSRHSNGLVLVVCPGVTTRNGLVQAWADLNNDKIPFMGFVVNRMKISLRRNRSSPVGLTQFPRSLQQLPLPKALREWLSFHKRST